MAGSIDCLLPMYFVSGNLVWGKLVVGNRTLWLQWVVCYEQFVDAATAVCLADLAADNW